MSSPLKLARKNASLFPLPKFTPSFPLLPSNTPSLSLSSSSLKPPYQHPFPNSHLDLPTMSAAESPVESSSLSHTVSRAQSVIESLSLILGPVIDSIKCSNNPASSLLYNQPISQEIMHRLRRTTSGSGTDDLCRWLYDTFQSNVDEFQLVVINYIPTLAGVYLCRAISSKETLAGFEAVFLALYSHKMVTHGAEPCILRLPNNMRISGAAESGKATGKGKAVATEPELTEAVLSPALEPCGTVRATKRGLIVSVALDLYCNKISLMPVYSKIEFCEFCIAWTGQDGLPGAKSGGEEENGEKEEQEEEEKWSRVPLSWELLQSVLRILGHCLLGPTNSEELKEKAFTAAKCLHTRAMKDLDLKAILASRSLLRLGNMVEEAVPELSLPASNEDLSELEAMKASISSR